MERLQKINYTPFVVDFGLTSDQHAMEHVVAVCKVSYRIDQYGNVELAARNEMQEVFKSDVYYDKPDSSSLKYAADMVIHKPGTDVSVVGYAYGQGRQRFVVGFEIKNLRKIMMVNSPKNCLLEKIPIRYEYARAGILKDRQGKIRLIPQGLDGCSLMPKVKCKPGLPIFELPAEAIQGDQTLSDGPVGMGCIPMGWKQRFRYAGTFDENWYRNKRPLMPDDFDRRFYNTVSQDQVLPRKIKGGEVVKLFGLHPRKPIVQFSIPAQRIRVSFYIKNQVVRGEMAADTLILEPDSERFSVVYRSACSIGSSYRYLQRVEFVAI